MRGCIANFVKYMAILCWDIFAHFRGFLVVGIFLMGFKTKPGDINIFIKRV